MATATCTTKIVTLLLASAGVAAEPPAAAVDDDPNGKLRIAVIHIDTRTGRRFAAGIDEALKEAMNRNAQLGELITVLTPPTVYPNEKEGVTTLFEMITQDRADLILGPTESGVFVRALEQREELEAKGVPVVASQVTADEPFQENGYFFLTNVNVKRRAEAMADYLHRYWLTSVAVLYADTEYGSRAETAFRRAFADRRRDGLLPLSYQPIYYDTGPLNVRDQILQILDSHPEAVGIFGEREHIKDIYRRFRELNYGTSSYRPQFFTVLDARSIDADLEDFIFVSVTDLEGNGADEASREHDDVWSLAYDSATLVVQTVEEIGAGGSRQERRSLVRNALEMRIGQNAVIPDTKTNMKFDHYENDTALQIFEFASGGLEPRSLEATPGVVARLGHKIRLLSRRYGVWPWLNLLLLIVVVALVSAKGIWQRYRGRLQVMLLNRYFAVLLLVNMVVAAVLWVTLAETGALRYDNIFTTLLVAFTPTALIRTVVVKTPIGKAVGLGPMYDDFLEWTNEKLIHRRYITRQPFINMIAYHNSQDGMINALIEIAEAHGPKKKAEIDLIIEQRLDGVDKWIDRRKRLAALLYEQLTWKQLEERNLAPEGVVTKHDSKQALRDKDPEVIVRRAARHCAEKPERSRKVDEIKNELLKEHRVNDPEWTKELEAALERDLEGVYGIQGRLRRKIRFLFLLRSFSERSLIDDDLLPRREV